MKLNILSFNNPIWFMRQAGRHLPEYKEIRSKKESFIDFCFDYESIVKSTLQPIARYDLDCAIIFSDILVVPYILGQRIDFIKGKGPKLEDLEINELLCLKTEKKRLEDLENCYKAIREVRKKLNKNKCLIGFCGAPWTVACYMIDGGNKNRFKKSKASVKTSKTQLKALLEKISDISTTHLINQYKSGCDTLMIFESWAGILDPEDYNDILYEPVEQIIKNLKSKNVDAPIIVFPKGIGRNIVEYLNHVSADVLSIDYETDLKWVINNIKKDIVLQGNINPILLLEGGSRLAAEVKKLKETVKGRKHIYNLGHGMLPDTPISNVQKTIRTLRT